MDVETQVIRTEETKRQRRRRTRGVFERKPGEWWVCYWDAQGRRRREKAGTWAAARDLYTKRKNQALEGKKLPERLRRATVTFADIAKDALAYSKTHKRTYHDDVQRMERILECFRTHAADSITPQEIERFLEDGIELRSNRGNTWKPSTVNHYRSLLSLTYRLAIQNGKASNNPARSTRHRKEDNSRVRYLTPEEEAGLRGVLQIDWAQHMPEFDLALHTGLRLSEMYRLDWQDIDMARRLILIRRGKNGESRYARLNSVALKALDELRKRGDGKGPVIRTIEGESLAGPRYWFEKAVGKAGLVDFYWHDLRHTFASRLAMAGVGLRAIQDALGHKSIAMTVRYSHLAPDFLLDVVEKLVLQSPSSTAASTATTTATKPFALEERQTIPVQ